MKGRDTECRMNVHWCLLFVQVLVFYFDLIQIDSFSPTMSKGKRPKRASQKRRHAHNYGGSLTKEKIKKKFNQRYAEKRRKSGLPTNWEQQSERVVPTSKALPSVAVLPVKVCCSQAYTSVIYQYTTIL